MSEEAYWFLPSRQLVGALDTLRTEIGMELAELLWSWAHRKDLLHFWIGEILGICKADGVKKCNDMGNRKELVSKES